jgi:predicted DNA-binding transcriptional regulator YafY
MSKKLRKKDRTARLLKIQLLLWRNPHGLTVSEIAEKCSICERTAYRDLKALERDLDVPIWEEGNRRGVVDGYYLPPVSFSQAEAVNIYLAVRLMQNCSYLYNPSMVTTFMKLSTIVPNYLRDQIQNTLDFVETLPRNENKLRILNELTNAWLSRRRVRIKFIEVGIDKPVESLVDPYFIEPSFMGCSSYIIAYSHLLKTICTLKIDHICEVFVCSDSYEIPPNFKAVDYFNSAWDIYTAYGDDNLKNYENIKTIKLLFTPEMSKFVTKTMWHPSQQTETQEDGSVIMKLKLTATRSFCSWIMRWGTEVEILEPQELRDQFTNIINSLYNIYCVTKTESKTLNNESNMMRTTNYFQYLKMLK